MKNYIQTTHPAALSLDPVLSMVKYTIDIKHKTPHVKSLDDRLGLGIPPTGNGIGNLLEETLPKTLISSEEAEKKRISQELHDGLGQILTSINLQIQQCLVSAQMMGNFELPLEMQESLLAIGNMTKQAMGEVRAICSALRPAILDDLGVLAAISWQCRQISQGCSRVKVETRYDIDESAIPEHYKTVLYRIVQEGLNNAVKYSQSDAVRVLLYRTSQTIELRIQDFGVGFDLAHIQAERDLGMGLVSMSERVESVGGLFRIVTAIGSGVELHISLPMEPASFID